MNKIQMAQTIIQATEGLLTMPVAADYRVIYLSDKNTTEELQEQSILAAVWLRAQPAGTAMPVVERALVKAGRFCILRAVPAPGHVLVDLPAPAAQLTVALCEDDVSAILDSLDTSHGRARERSERARFAKASNAITDAQFQASLARRRPAAPAVQVQA